jgi:TonB family protein
VIWSIAATVVAVAAIASGLWLGRGALGPASPAATPTPSAAEIAARRQAQEDRLRSMTQAMVQEMMAEKETEIRQELMARQQRIEELQRRLQRSERRAAQSASAAAEEAATQQTLIAEIEAQEKAQREQQKALEAEIQDTAPTTVADAVGNGTSNERQPDPSAPVGATDMPTMRPSPTVAPPEPEPTAATAVRPGDFVDPTDVDQQPVVIKNQPLTWTRSAIRSGEKGIVIVRVTVNASGSVDEVEILRADHDGHGIPEAAAEAAAGCHFKPGFKDGVPVTTHAFVTWRYDFTKR